MIALPQRPSSFLRRRPCLSFSPLAWLKLQHFCHAGDTEIGGFGITATNDLLHVEDFISVRQRASSMTVSLADDAVADYMDRCVDAGLAPQNFLRIWCHTHPGSSAEPSGIDEETFARVFGACDWAVMFILSRTGNTYARLSFHAGPGGTVHLPVSVDWSAWPDLVNDPAFSLPRRLADWQTEFTATIQRIPESLHLYSPALAPSIEVGNPWEPFAETWDWTDFDQQPWEETEHDERIPTGNQRA